MRVEHWGVTLLVGAAVFFAAPVQPAGFEQTKTCDESGPFACDSDQAPMPVHWNTRCVDYHINGDGSDSVNNESEQVSDIEQLRDEIRLSFATWTQVECSDMTLVYKGLTDTEAAGFNPDDGDELNLVVWRDEQWSSQISTKAFAVTSVTFNPNNGVIRDADVEFNTEMYDYSLTDEPLANHVDLRNTAVHEVGHVVGLDHSREQEATMFGTAAVGETKKRILHPDDIDGICTMYPSTDRSQADCDGDTGIPEFSDDLAEPEESSCAATGADGAPPAGLAAVLAGLIGFACARRMRA